MNLEIVPLLSIFVKIECILVFCKAFDEFLDEWYSKRFEWDFLYLITKRLNRIDVMVMQFPGFIIEGIVKIGDNANQK